MGIFTEGDKNCKVLTLKERGNPKRTEGPKRGNFKSTRADKVKSKTMQTIDF